MDNQINTEQKTSPELTNETRTSSSYTMPIVVGTFMLLLGLGLGYILFANKTATQQIIDNSAILPEAESNNESPTMATNNSQSTDSQTYENKEVGISFSYPTDWTTTPYSIESSYTHGVIGLISKGDTNNSGTPAAITLSYFDNPEKLTLQQYEEKNKRPAGALGVYTDSSMKVVGPMGPASYQAEGDCSPFKCEKYVFSVENKIFVLSRFIEPQSDNKEIFDEIFSSIKVF